MITLSDGTELNTYLACAICEGFCEGENYQDKDNILLAWSYVGKNKLYLTLQGFYGRTLRNLVGAGYLDENFNVLV